VKRKISGPSETAEASSSIASHVERAHRYAADVTAGKILACKWVKLACQRHLNDLEQSKTDESYPYRFDEHKAARICRFVESLPHVKGDWARKDGRNLQIRLEDWQCFIYCAVFGWIRRDNRTRRFRKAYICVPRKNGKSALSAGLGLYMLAADGEAGAEVYTGATCERQAWEVFRPAKQMLERTPQLQQLFGIKAGARNLHTPEHGGRFQPLVGDPGDGASPSCGIVDEYHEHRTDRLYDTLLTGMGARLQPLLWIITTAGSNTGGPCRSFQTDCEKVLEGIVEQDDLFAIIYTIDEGDDWTSEEALRKANPNYDVSVYGSFLKAEQAAALASARKQSVFQTKHLNVWVGASVAWLNMTQWRALADPTLNEDDLRGCSCSMAADLSSKLDITAVVRVYRKKIERLDHFYVFARFYVPAERVKDPERTQYPTWKNSGHLTTTPGNVLDYDFIADDAISDIKRSKVAEFGFDPWNAEQFAQRIAKETPATPVEIPQQVRHLSEPMKQLEALTIDGRIHHDGNPVLAWMLSNVVARIDAKGNIYPNKERAQNSIDGAVALIMALSRELKRIAARSVYAIRGLRTL
jgi:phage terminase large subunit-like protein